MHLVVVPCFNEASRFPLEGWRQTILANPDFQWIFVNDGSRDQTLTVLGQLNFSNVQILNLERNSGKGEAIRLGALKALDTSQIPLETISYLDADGAFSSNDISKFHDNFSSLRDGNKAISCLIASRVKLSGRAVSRSFYRHLIGRVLLTFLCFRWDKAPYDTQSGFKIFKVNNEFIEAITSPFKTRWFFDVELLIRLEKRRSLIIWEEPVNYWEDVAGSKVNLGQSLRILKELFIVRRQVYLFLKERNRNGFN